MLSADFSVLLSDPNLDVLADAMVADLQARQPLRDLTAHLGDDVTRAYALQDAYRDALVASGVRRGMSGYKVGRNGPPHRQPDGSTGAVSAPIFSDQMMASGARLDLQGLMTPNLECEVCAEIADTVPLSATPYTRDTIAPYVSRLVAAFEIIDFRGRPQQGLPLTSLIAHGVFGGGMVLGTGGIAPDQLDVATLPCDLQVDGQRVAAAIGAAPEHPLDAVAWMANHLARRNRRLEPGMLLLCGTHLPALSIAPGQHVALYMGPVGQVDLICD